MMSPNTPMGLNNSTPALMAAPMYQNHTNFDNLASNTNWSATTGNFNNKWANNQSQTVKQDWSAFESLLPNQNGNQENSNTTKKLSNNDMMDLLG